MKKLLGASLTMCLVLSAAAQEAPSRKTCIVFNWESLNVQQQFPGSKIISMDGILVLKVENTNNAPLGISLFTFTNSSLIKNATAIACDMKYENVQEIPVMVTNRNFIYRDFTTRDDKMGALTFIAHIPPSALGGDEIDRKQFKYFVGTLNWKTYQFSVAGERPPNAGDRPSNEGWPTNLEVKLSLPANGTVYLRPIQLLGVTGNWWPTDKSSTVGGAVGIFGGFIGCLGGLVGCLAGFGKARKFVLTTTKLFIALGMLLTITGIIAIVCKQPYFVWYVFLAPGVILTLVFSLNFPLIQRRYDDLEIRRMASLDV